MSWSPFHIAFTDGSERCISRGFDTLEAAEQYLASVAKTRNAVILSPVQGVTCMCDKRSAALVHSHSTCPYCGCY